MNFFSFRLQLDWAFHHARRSHQVRGDRGQSRLIKLVLHVAKIHREFIVRKEIRTRRQCASIYRRNLVNRGEIEDAIAISLQIGKCLTSSTKSQNTSLV